VRQSLHLRTPPVDYQAYTRHPVKTLLLTPPKKLLDSGIAAML
jgi:hypothetical protein